MSKEMIAGKYGCIMLCLCLSMFAHAGSDRNEKVLNEIRKFKSRFEAARLVEQWSNEYSALQQKEIALYLLSKIQSMEGCTYIDGIDEAGMPAKHSESYTMEQERYMARYHVSFMRFDCRTLGERCAWAIQYLYGVKLPYIRGSVDKEKLLKLKKETIKRMLSVSFHPVLVKGGDLEKEYAAFIERNPYIHIYALEQIALKTTSVVMLRALSKNPNIEDSYRLCEYLLFKSKDKIVKENLRYILSESKTLDMNVPSDYIE